MRTAAMILAGLAVVATAAGCESPRHHHHRQPQVVAPPQKHQKHHNGAVPPPVHSGTPRSGNIPPSVPPPNRR